MPFKRRDFLNLAALGLGGLAVRPFGRLFRLADFPQSERLGRVNAAELELKARPDADSQTLGLLHEDDVVPWLRELPGRHPRTNQRWVETPDGYLWSPYVQPVRHFPNTSLDTLPGTGIWAEVSVPYVDLVLDNPPARAPWLAYKIEHNLPARLYYSQVVWIDALQVDGEGQTWYRVNERYGSYGDIFWAAAEAFRPLTEEDLIPIRPEVEGKRVVVDVTYQTLACFEGNTEVYFARISSGAET